MGIIKEKYMLSSRRETVALSASAVKSVRFVDARKCGYRVSDGRHIGIFGVAGNATPEQEAWKRAEENLANRIPYSAQPAANRSEHVDVSGGVLSEKEFKEAAESFAETLKKRFPGFLFGNDISREEEEVRLVNDVGLDLSYKTAYYTVSLLMSDKNSAGLFDLGYEYAGREFDIEKMCADIAELERAYRTPADIGEGEHIVFSSPYDLGFGKLVEGILADSYANGTGLFAGKRGEQVFDDRVSLYEDRNPETTLAVPFFDAEGAVRDGYRNYVFRNGVFVSPVASGSDAVKYRLPATGSAIAEYDGVPTTGIVNLKPESSGKTMRQLTAGEEAIYLVMASGGDTTPDGNFATPVQTAFLWRDGKFVGKLPTLGISGNLFDLYGKNYLGLAEDSLSHTDCKSYYPLAVRMTVRK